LSGWRPTDLAPGVYLFLLAFLLTRALRRWYDPVPGRVLAVFAAVLLALFGEVLFAGRVLLPLDSLRNVVPLEHLAPPDHPGNLLQSDLVRQITPTLLAVRRASRAGEWPLWDPTIASGMPLLADPQSQFLQPLVLLAAPFPMAQAAGIIAALRVLVALVFTYLFLIRQGLGRGPGLLGSLAYGLSGFLVLWLGWPLANAAALLPFVLYALSRCDGRCDGDTDRLSGRRDFFLLGVALWALLLAGQPEVIVYSLALSGAFLLSRLRRRPRGRRWSLLLPCAAAGLLALAAAAPSLAPTAAYLPQTERSRAIAGVRESASWAALSAQVTTPEGRARWEKRVVERLVPAAAPNAWGNNRYGAYWGSTAINQDAGAFVGGTALLLALLSLLARRRFPEERLMLGGAIVGLLAVAQPPALSPLLLRVPIVGSTAIHANQRVTFVIAFCLAYLAACGAERWARGEGRLSMGWIGGITALLAGLVVWAYLAHPSPSDPNALAGFRHAWLAGQLAILVATAILLSLPRLRGCRSLPVLLAVLTTAELLAAHGPANPPMPRRLAFPLTPPLAFLRDHLGAGDRMAALGMVLPPNLASAYGLPDIRVYNPMAPDRYEQALAPIEGKAPYDFPILERPRHPLYDFLGVRWLLTDPDHDMPRGMRLVFRHPDGWVWERPHPLPRLFLPAPGDASRLEDLRVEPARVHARSILAERELVVASLYQDGGWRLVAGGVARETVLANGPFVAAWVSPKISGAALDLDLLYRPPGFLGGCLLGALALALGGLWWIPPPVRFAGLRVPGRRESDHDAHQDGGEQMEEEAGEVR